MIIIRMHGGLGNQMFQYALGRNLSLLHNVPLKIDPSYLEKENQSGRTLRINGFKTLLDEATPDEIRTYRSTLQKILDRMRPKALRKKVLEPSPEFDRTVSTVKFDPAILERSDGYFVGHWNDERYFKTSEVTLRKDFELKNPFGTEAKKITEKIVSESEPVSVHIRRGDYVTIPKVANVHRTLPLSYYKEAMEKIQQQAPMAHFFISSDDIDWVKENFPKNYPLTFVSSAGIPDYEELILMSQCRHHVIANSTFSWWAAWLNQKKGKIVIAPKQWLRDPKKDNPNLLPASWIQI